MPIQLRPIGRADIDFLHACRLEPSSQRHNPLEPLTLAELRRRYAHVGHDLGDKTHADYRWVAWCEGTPVGYASVKGISWRMGVGDLGYGVAERFQGRGVGKALVRALVDKAFAESDLRRLTACVSVRNQASWRILESLGFVREGTLRAHFVIQGEAVDEHFYGILRHEWPTPQGGQAT